MTAKELAKLFCVGIVFALADLNCKNSLKSSTTKNEVERLNCRYFVGCECFHGPRGCASYEEKKI